jgi:hypothetical protein
MRELASEPLGSSAHVDATRMSRNPVPAHAAASDGGADASEPEPSTRNSEGPGGDPDHAAALLSCVAEEVGRAHRLSLGLQELFSRAFGEVDARADVIQDAQGLDRLSQTLENLARVLQLISATHPQPPCQRQIEECLTLEELRLHLGRGVTSPPPALRAGSTNSYSGGRDGAISTPDAEGCTVENGEISWL